MSPLLDLINSIRAMDKDITRQEAIIRNLLEIRDNSVAKIQELVQDLRGDINKKQDLIDDMRGKLSQMLRKDLSHSHEKISEMEESQLAVSSGLRDKLSEATELRAQLATAGLRIIQLESEVAGQGAARASRSRSPRRSV